MPSWWDGSSGDSYSFLDNGGCNCESCDCDCEIKVEKFLEYIRGTEWNGMETEEDIKCKCGKRAHIYVAFDTTDLGRRFHRCMHEVDPEWSIELTRAIQMLWWKLEDKEEEKENAIWDGIAEVVSVKCTMEEEKKKLEMDYADRIVAMEARIDMMRAEVQKYRRWMYVASGEAVSVCVVFLSMLATNG